MNTLNAVELKLRGMVAIEEALAFGPVHLYKDNRPAAVVLLESEYHPLMQKRSARKNVDTVRWIMDLKPASLSRSKEEIDKQITLERSCWEEE